MANNITRWTKSEFPNTLLAVDPGASWPGAKLKHPYAGVALFQWGMLVWVSLVHCPVTDTGRYGRGARYGKENRVPPYAMPNLLVRKVCKEASVARNDDSDGESLTVLAVEKPILYKHGQARPEDILNLRGIWGAFMGGIDAEQYFGPTPEEWKGSIDGEILNERVVKVLNHSERMMLVDAQRQGKGGLTSHVVDAAGLGLFTLGRMGKAGVI